MGFASASGNTTSAGRTLHFEVQFSPFFFLDLGEPGPSMGDQIVSHDVLLDETGQPVGHDGVSCTVTDPAVPEAECTAMFAVPGGQITTQFLNTPATGEARGRHRWYRCLSQRPGRGGPGGTWRRHRNGDVPPDRIAGRRMASSGPA
jgi:hypothetical protein